MRGFRFRSSLISDPREKLSSGLRRHPAKAQLLVAREKKTSGTHGSCFQVSEYKRVRGSLVEVYETIQKSVISI